MIDEMGAVCLKCMPWKEKKSVEDGQTIKESFAMKDNKATGRDNTRQGVRWVPGAYVNTKGPLDPKDVELIQNCVRDCRKEWEKEKEPPQKDGSGEKGAAIEEEGTEGTDG